MEHRHVDNMAPQGAPRPIEMLLGVGTSSAVWVLIALTLTMEARLGELRELLGGFSLFSLVAAVAFGLLGTVLVRSKSAGTIAWIALAIAGSQSIALASASYGFEAIDRGWPGATWAVWLSQWSWVSGYLLVPTLLLLLFPDGRLPSKRWWWAHSVGAAGVVVSSLGWALLAYEDQDAHLDTAVVNPFASPIGGPLLNVGGLLAAIGAIAALLSLALRFRNSRGKQRQQIKWIFLAAGVTTVLLVTARMLGSEAAPPLVALAMVPLPSAMGLAILRHRLWDVDVVLSKAFVYGILTAAVLVIYAGAVTFLSRLIGAGSDTPPLIAVALVAVAIEPIRRKLQTVANRLLYGDRTDPYTALSRLTERLDAVSQETSVLSEVSPTIRRLLRLSYVAIEVDGHIRSESGHRRESLMRIPISYRGRIGAALVVGSKDEVAMTAAQKSMLAEMTRHIGVALYAEELSHELQRSRESLVNAREEERRRIRRDLHDDLGPALAAAALQVERARDLITGDTQMADAVLEKVAGEVRETVRSVRSIVEDLGAPALDDLGLEAAMREQVNRLSMHGPRVQLEIAAGLPDLPAAVEVAAYRIASEALTNVLKHANATYCRVQLDAPDDLRIVVEDDGRGVPKFAPEGVGLRSMLERTAELGGRFEVGISPLGGARVMATLPVTR